MLDSYNFTSFLMIPFSFECESGQIQKVEKTIIRTGIWQYETVNSYMIYSYVNNLLNKDNSTRIGSHFCIDTNSIRKKSGLLCESLLAVGKRTRTIDDIVNNSCFAFDKSDLYLFDTGVGFLVLRINYNNVSTFSDIWQTSYDDLHFVEKTKDGALTEFDIRKVISSLVDFTPCDLFFATKNSTSMTDAFAFSLGRTKEQVGRNIAERKALHLLYAAEDHEITESNNYLANELFYSEQSISYCVSTRGIAFTRINYNKPLSSFGDFEQKVYVPLIIFALYQKYTCLYFSEKLGTQRNHREFAKLKKKIVSFKSYGIISMVSQRLITSTLFKYILETQGLTDILSEIENKLSVLLEKEQEERNAKLSVFGTLITAMGIVSIITDGADIINTLLSGDQIGKTSIGITTLLGCVLMVIGTIIAVSKGNKKSC